MPNFSCENKFYLREDLKTQKNKKKKNEKEAGCSAAVDLRFYCSL